MLNRESEKADQVQKADQAPLFHLHDAVVRRDGKQLLSVGDFVLDEGESIAILGPNGAGKSTLVKLMTREILPLHRDVAPVLFRGRARASLDDIKKSIGVVSSSMQDQISVHLSALEVVVGGLFGVLGIPRHVSASDEDFELARKAMHEVGVADLSDRDVMTLSTGQARRVLIARAKVGAPRVLVLDEPCSGLDLSGMYYMRRTMTHLANQGCALVLVTHYPEDIVPAIKRIVLVKDGEVYADGSKDELLVDGCLSDLFGVPLRVLRDGQRYAVVDRY